MEHVEIQTWRKNGMATTCHVTSGGLRISLGLGQLREYIINEGHQLDFGRNGAITFAGNHRLPVFEIDIDLLRMVYSLRQP